MIQMIVSKVKIEIRFTQRVPKKVLEGAVERFADMGKQFIAPYKKHDPTVHVRVWYDDRAGVSDVKMSDLLPSNPLRRVFKRRR